VTQSTERGETAGSDGSAYLGYLHARIGGTLAPLEKSVEAQIPMKSAQKSAVDDEESLWPETARIESNRI